MLFPVTVPVPAHLGALRRVRGGRRGRPLLRRILRSVIVDVAATDSIGLQQRVGKPAARGHVETIPRGQGHLTRSAAEDVDLGTHAGREEPAALDLEMCHGHPRRPARIELLDALPYQAATLVAVTSDHVQLVAHDKQAAPEAPDTQHGPRDPKPHDRVQDLHRGIALAILIVADAPGHPQLALKRHTRMRRSPHAQTAVQLRPHHAAAADTAFLLSIPAPRIHYEDGVGTLAAVPVVASNHVHFAVEHGANNGGQFTWQRRARGPPVGDRVEAFNRAI